MYRERPQGVWGEEAGGPDARGIVTRATLTCPECQHAQEVNMPTDACQFFYECIGCKSLLRPREGDCCVFCSYADTLCPSKQMEESR